MTTDPLDSPLRARIVFYTPDDQALPALIVDHLRLDGLSEQQILVSVDRHLSRALAPQELAPSRWLTQDPDARRVLIITTTASEGEQGADAEAALPLLLGVVTVEPAT